MQTVKYVGIGSAAVEIEKEQTHFRKQLPHFLLYSYGNNMVGNTPKRLQTDHIVHTVSRQLTHFARKRPTFAKIGCQIQHLRSHFGIIKNIGEGTVKRKCSTNPVEAAHTEP